MMNKKRFKQARERLASMSVVPVFNFYRTFARKPSSIAKTAQTFVLARTLARYGITFQREVRTDDVFIAMLCSSAQ
jgi:hypothetical protein